MLLALKKLLGYNTSVNFTELIEKGAIIIDVRSKAEFSNGHIKGAINIPVNTLNTNFGILKDKNQLIITCCASGIRSASAKSILNSNGFSFVYNGGGWSSLQNKL